MFSPRQQQLLLLLLGEQSPTSVAQLAQQLGSSSRTLFRELSTLDELLLPFEVRLVTKPGAGVWLEGNTSAKEDLAAHLDLRPLAAPDPAQRRQQLIGELLRHRDIKKLYHYAAQFSVSEATISKDMDAVAPWFAEQGLGLLRRPGYGVSLEGTEREYRQAVARYMHQCAGEEGVPLPQHRSPASLVDAAVFDQVQQTLQSIGDRQVTSLAENSSLGLALHLSIAVQRLQQGQSVSMPEQLLGRLRSDPAYSVAEHITQQLAQAFNLPIPPAETAYLCIQIKGAKRQDVAAAEGDGDLFLDNIELLSLIREMIHRFDPQQAAQLQTDEQLLAGLVAHLQPTIIRLRHQMEIRNPLLEQVRQMYRDTFDRCQQAATVLSEAFDCQVPQDEVGFLTMHFGAAQERLRQQGRVRRTVTIGVICTSGIGASSLMCSRLKSAFHDSIAVQTYSLEQLPLVEQAPPDILLTTIAVENLPAKTLRVDPLLPQSHLDLLREEIRRYAYEPPGRQPTQLHQPGRPAQLAGNILSLLAGLSLHTIPADTSYGGLFGLAGELFGDSPHHSDRIAEDLYRREQLGQVVSPEFGFLLLHAKTSGSDSVRFGALLPDRAEFRDPLLEGIRMVLVMLLPDQAGERTHSQTQIMGWISSRLVAADGRLPQLIAQGDTAALSRFLSRELNSHFFGAQD